MSKRKGYTENKKKFTNRKNFPFVGNLLWMAIFVSIVFVSLGGGATMAATQSDKRVAVVLINFQNDRTQPYTAEYAKSMVFGTINSFYRENSFGKATITGDVFGWYTVPYTNSVCSYNQWGSAANDILVKNGVNPSSYDYIIYVFPRTSACPWTGLGVMGGNKLWDNGRLTLGIVGHEFGHNIGFKHSNIMNCYDSTGNRVSISGNCKVLEYSDPYDIMGSGTFSTNYAAHFSAFNKASAGWLSASNMATVTSSGIYKIYPDEIQSNGIQSLRIPKDKDAFGNPTSYYYLEFRQPYGFDNYWRFTGTSPASNGVTIRVAPDYGFSETALVDTTPGTATFEDAPLLAGKTFTDSAKGISITTLSTGPDGATVSIAFTKNTIPPQPLPTTPTRKNPTLTLTASTRLADGTQKYSVRLTNNDDASFGASTFTVSAALPGQLTQSPRWISVSNVAPGSTVTFSLSVIGTSSGTFTETATNSVAPSYTTSTTASYVK